MEALMPMPIGAAQAPQPKPPATAEEVLAMMFQATGCFKQPVIGYLECAGLKPPLMGPLSHEQLNSLRRIFEVYACE